MTTARKKVTPKKARRKPRRWRPRPSPAARGRILAAARALLADPDARGWTAGFTFTVQHLAAIPSLRLRRWTLYSYLSALARGGDLTRVRQGVYELPAGNR